MILGMLVEREDVPDVNERRVWAVCDAEGIGQ